MSTSWTKLVRDLAQASKVLTKQWNWLKIAKLKRFRLLEDRVSAQRPITIPVQQCGGHGRCRLTNGIHSSLERILKHTSIKIQKKSTRISKRSEQTGNRYRQMRKQGARRGKKAKQREQHLYIYIWKNISRLPFSSPPTSGHIISNGSREKKAIWWSDHHEVDGSGAPLEVPPTAVPELLSRSFTRWRCCRFFRWTS